MDESAFKERLTNVKARIRKAEKSSLTKPGSVKLLAVTKGVSIPVMEYAIKAGITAFGESYWQETQGKIEALSNYSITWHFIGPLQSNKCKPVAQHFSWVHSVSRLKIATRLNNERSMELPLLNICIQVKFDDEPGKSGITQTELPALVEHILKLSRLRLRGLMLIPKPTEDEALQLQSFLQLKDLLNQINKQFDLSLDTLSMGMSYDLKPAICAGSTIVRIGRALFGDRE